MGALPAMRVSAGCTDFINEAHLNALLAARPADPERVRDIIAKSLAMQALSVEETAVLLRTEDRDRIEAVFQAAQTLKERIYGNRIVIFAPLYIGNRCVNDCRYCGFKRSNRDAIRRTLGRDDMEAQVRALQRAGHKRLILVFGEHPVYDAAAIAEAVRAAYGIKEGRGEIRRVNINAAPLDEEGFRAVKAAGIGTYQIFMETYRRATYARVHPAYTRKGDYLYRLDALNRALEAGCDDVGIGALFGLDDWRFEVLGLVAHALHLQERYRVGPHTISFPRIKPASGVHPDRRFDVSDDDFARVVAILRLAVPYAGLILTAREAAPLRRTLMAFGVSQIDAGTRLEIGGYTEAGDAQVMEREQFSLGDVRSLDEVIVELVEDGYMPSFCTACYRLGRTGEHFMEFAIPGFIKRFCTPNALTTFKEYLVDYASARTRAAGERRIAAELAALPDDPQKAALARRLEAIESSGARDLYC